MMLVEGDTDAHVLKNLGERREHNIPLAYSRDPLSSPSAIRIEKKDGVSGVLEDITVRLKGRGSGDLERLGIIVDADDNIVSRWRELKQALIIAGYNIANIPAAPGRQGTIIKQDGKVTVGIWVMPDNKLNGELEDFIAFLVKPEDPLWGKAGASTQDVMTTVPEADRFADSSRSKAHLHTWLAWQKDCGTPIGWAITKRYLDPGSPYARELISWVRDLFG
jgi:hypothetical protein